MKNIITFIFLVFCYNAYSSDRLIAYPNIAVKTPKASALDTYNNIPVSFYTGIPNIQIPIYEINIDDVKIPITLNYHSSGIRVSQESTWVGLGWSLDTGGLITREVNTADDFLERFQDWAHPTIKTGFYDGPHYTISNPDSLYVLTGHPDPIAWISLRWDLISDPEPDVFSYSIPGYSGKFIFDNNRKPVLFSRNHNIRVEIVRTHGMQEVCIKLTDGQGNQYFFNDEEISENYMSSGALNKNSTSATAKYDDSTSDYITWEYIDELANEDDDGWVATEVIPYQMTSAWCLTRIVTNQGRNIIFTYEDEKEYMTTQESSVIYNTDRYGRDQQFCRSKVVNYGKRLAKIEWDEGCILFKASDREDIKGTAKKLDRIVVKNKKGDTVKDYNFSYTYFNDDYTGEDKYTHVFKRLKLVGLTESSYSLSPGYTFDYYEGKFPAKNSKNTDYWGMQNGREYGQEYCIGLILNGKVYPGVSKESEFSYSVIGSLKRITYPTGGYAKFTYESNHWDGGIGIDINNDMGSYKENAPVSGTTFKMAVYNNYEIDEHPDLPASDTLHFRIDTPSTRLSIDYNLENHQCYFIDPDYRYGVDHILELYKLSKTGSRSLYYRKVCPYLYEISNNGSATVTSDGCELSGDIGKSLDVGEYELIANCPPKDVCAEWYIKFDHLITWLNVDESGNATPYNRVPVLCNDGAGLRIAKIETDESTRTFLYSRGTLMRTPVLYYFGRRPGYSTSTPSAVVQVSESKSPLSTFGLGNYVGYDWVEEQVKTGDNLLRKRYYYMNEPENEQFDDNFPESPYLINYTNGLLTKKETYWGQKLVKEERMTYSTTSNNCFYVLRDKSEHWYTDYMYSYFYEIEWPVMNSITEIRYENNGNITRSVSYTYNSHDLPATQVETINGNVVRTTMRYPFDFQDNMNDSLTSRNRVISPVEVTKSVNEKVVSGEKITYSVSKDLLVPSVAYQLNTVNGLLPEYYSTAFRPLFHYNYYTENGHPQEIWHNADVTTYLWSYYGLHPCAKIEGLSYSEVERTIGKQTITKLLGEAEPSTAELNSLRNAITKAGGHITTYTYKPLIGIMSQTLPNGNTVNYKYDGFGRLKETSDVNDKILQKYFYNYKSR